MAGFSGMALWVILTANWYVFIPVAFLITGTIIYIVFWRNGGPGERADAKKHAKRLAKRYDKQAKKVGAAQPDRDYGRFNLDPRTINPVSPTPVQTTQQAQPEPPRPTGS